jgi:hypothetical protein
MTGRSSGVTPKERDVRRVQGVLAHDRVNVAPELPGPNRRPRAQPAGVGSVGISPLQLPRSKRVRAIYVRLAENKGGTAK